MKPERIFIVRHGQSIGNVDKSVYKDTPDYAIQLTDKGKQQALDIGTKLKEIISEETVQFYVSPMWRTRQTYAYIRKSFPSIYPDIYKYYEDPRLREQEWGMSMEGYRHKLEEYRDSYGHFYYRFRDGGESCADVFDRASDFLNTMHRDFEKRDFPHNAIETQPDSILHGNKSYRVVNWSDKEENGNHTIVATCDEITIPGAM